MDWRQSLQSSLKATEHNLARLQQQSSNFAGGRGLAEPHAVQGANAYPSASARRAADAQPHQQFSVPIGSVYQEHTDSLHTIKSTLRSIGTEIDLERQAREDSVRELSRRSTHEISELREAVRQLRDDNQDLRRSLSSLERRTHFPLRGATHGGDSSEGPLPGNALQHASSAALLPRVSDLEAIVQQHQQLFDSRRIRHDETTRDMVQACVEAEVERMRSIAREAARDSTDEYIKLRTEAVQQLFATQLESIKQANGSVAAHVAQAERQWASFHAESQQKLRTVEEKVLQALEAKEKWVHVSTEVHELVRAQLDSERVRADETLRLLRAEVSTSVKRASQESIDAQHALQHFVNQRLESLAMQFMARDEASKLLQSATQQCEHEVSSAKKLMNAYKAQFDDSRAETLKYVQSSESKWADLRAAVDELNAQRLAEMQQSQRIRAAVDDMQHKVKTAVEAADEASLKVVDLSGRVDQLHYAVGSVERELSSGADSTAALMETMRRTSQEQHSALTSKLTSTTLRLEQAHGSLKEESEATRELIDALQRTIREAGSTTKKQIMQCLKDAEDGIISKCESATVELIAKEGQDVVRKAVQEASRSVQIQFSQHWTQEIAAKWTAAIEDRVADSNERATVRLASVTEDAKRHAESLVSQCRSEWAQQLSVLERSLTETLTRDTASLLREAAIKAKDETQRVVSELKADLQHEQLNVKGQLADTQRKQIEAAHQQNQAAYQTLLADVTAAVKASSDDARNSIAKMERSLVARIQEVEERGSEDRATLRSVDAMMQSFHTKVNQTQQQLSLVHQQTADASRSAAAVGQQQVFSSNSLRSEEETTSVVERARQRILVDVDAKLDDLSQTLKKRVAEATQTFSESLAMHRRLVNEIDERVTTLTVSTASVSLPSGASALASSGQGGQLQGVRNVPHAEIEQALQRRLDEARGVWLQPLTARLDAIEESLHRRDAAPAQSADGLTFESVQHQIEAAVEAALDEFDSQTIQSLEALDEKMNAFAETLSNREQERDTYVKEVVRSSLLLLRDMESSSETSGTGSSHHSTLLMQHSSAADNAAHIERHPVAYIIKCLSEKLAQCSDAIHTISVSALDTVDLIQRHEAGFASINELVQAILVNSQNIATLAEAIGLDKAAFTMTLNNAEFGGVSYRTAPTYLDGGEDQ